MTIDMDLWNGIGLGSREVVLADWSDAWPSLFNDEARSIQKSCKGIALELEHIGGTSVPGSRCRPVIDIMVGIEHLRDSGSLIEPLKDIGYRCHGENGVPGRRHFTRSHDQRCLVNLQMFQLNSELWNRALTIRDRLRGNSDLVLQFIEVKRDLESRYPDNPEEYQNGKATFEEWLHVGNVDSSSSS